jgi:hypothetical protein
MASFGLTVSKMSEQAAELEKAKRILAKIVAKQNATVVVRR